MSSSPVAILDHLSEVILSKGDAKPLLVAINGKDASGKTILAQNLVAHLTRQTDRPVIGVSFDGFLNEASIRNAPFESEGEGSYNHAFNYGGFLKHFLVPLTSGKPYSYVPKIYDVTTDTKLAVQPVEAAPASIFIVDGLFLFREELRGYWDVKVLLEASDDIIVKRGAERDSAIFGGYERARHRFLNRYLPSQEIYFSETSPEALADIIIENSEPQRAFIKS